MARTAQIPRCRKDGISSSRGHAEFGQRMAQSRLQSESLADSAPHLALSHGKQSRRRVLHVGRRRPSRNVRRVVRRCPADCVECTPDLRCSFSAPAVDAPTRDLHARRGFRSKVLCSAVWFGADAAQATRGHYSSRCPATVPFAPLRARRSQQGFRFVVFGRFCAAPGV